MEYVIYLAIFTTYTGATGEFLMWSWSHFILVPNDWLFINSSQHSHQICIFLRREHHLCVNTRTCGLYLCKSGIKVTKIRLRHVYQLWFWMLRGLKFWHCMLLEGPNNVSNHPPFCKRRVTAIHNNAGYQWKVIHLHNISIRLDPYLNKTLATNMSNTFSHFYLW